MKGGPKSSLRPFLHRALQLEHVSKSDAYLYAVIFDPNNKNFENGGGRIP